MPRRDGRSFLFPFLHVLGLPIRVPYFLQCTINGFLFGFPISCSTFLRYSGFLFPLPLYMYSGFLFPFLLYRYSGFLFPFLLGFPALVLYYSNSTELVLYLGTVLVRQYACTVLHCTVVPCTVLVLYYQIAAPVLPYWPTQSIIHLGLTAMRIGCERIGINHRYYHSTAE